jgi:hypothetical protein
MGLAADTDLVTFGNATLAITGAVTGVTALTVDNININGNTISSTAGTDLLITPLAGQQIVLDGTIIIDAGVVTGATSITSTEFHGGGGNLTGISAGTALTGSTNNTIPTVTGANAITGEASLTFDNAALAFDRDHDGNNAINLINDSNTSSASTRLTIQTGGASAGDAVALFHAGGDSYCVGVDNSDRNRFKISATGGNLGTNDVLVIEPGGANGWLSFTGVACHLYLSSNQTVSNASETYVISWDGTTKDDYRDATYTSGLHDSGYTGGTQRMYIPLDGWYNVGAQATWYGGTTGIRRVQIQKNGVVICQDRTTVTASYDPRHSCSVVHYFTAGQYLEVEAYQSSGSGLILYNGNTHFWLVKVG